jgi:hypothetical protein
MRGDPNMFRHRLTLIIAAVALVTVGLTVRAQQFEAQQYEQVIPNPGGGGGEHYAPNLGIYYQLVPYSPYGGGYNQGGYNPYSPPGYGGGYRQAPIQAPVPTQSFGARLTRYPVPDSPAAFLQLEPGDMIISLDGLPIQTPNDVLAHQNQTSMVFVNIRTGQPQPANIYIP